MIQASHTAVELRVFDVRLFRDAEILIPLVSLIDELVKVCPAIRQSSWTIHRGADGRGALVGDIVSSLELSETVSVNGEDVYEAVAHDQQYFDNVRIDVGEHLVFGVFDSTFLYCRTSPEIADRLSSAFKQTKILPIPPL